MNCDALQTRRPSRMRPRRAPASRFLAGHVKSGAFGTGSWTDTPPRFGCCMAAEVAVREPSRNQRPTISPSLQSAGAALSANLLNIKERQKPKQLKKNLSRRSPHGGPFGYFVSFTPDRATPTNDLRPTETGAVFVFCNISTVETSNFTMGSGPSDRTSPVTAFGILFSFHEEETNEGQSECKHKAIAKALYLHRLLIPPP